MTANIWQIRRVALIQNSRYVNSARYEDAHKQLSRLQKCPVVKTNPKTDRARANLFNKLFRVIDKAIPRLVSDDIRGSLRY
jgi:hypothetical protein